ncbi:hypothetical protein V6N13_060905 [Hibiscus sabdariffa]|uniref:Uncharacterized protein n=2 Tax=Hibiscus sabdariffa TaxID=183260 RepID=A0ABR2AZP5_9ROSI
MAYSIPELLLNHEQGELRVPMILRVPNFEEYEFRGSPMDGAEIYQETEIRVPAAWEMVGNFCEDDFFRAPKKEPVRNYGVDCSLRPPETKTVKNYIDKDEGIPVGFRFEPTDEELAAQHLISKVSGDPLSASDFREVEATEFYGQHPKCLGRY